jgi:hypothetical protein
VNLSGCVWKRSLRCSVARAEVLADLVADFREDLVLVVSSTLVWVAYAFQNLKAEVFAASFLYNAGRW